LSLSLEGGSFGTARGAASLVAGGETARLRATVSAVRTDGISRAASGVEADGYRSIAASFYGALEPGEVWRGSVSARFSDSLAEIDGFPPPFFALADTEETEATREFSAAARAEHDTGAFRGGFTLAFSRIDRLNEDAGAVLFDALGERWTLDYLGSVDIDERVALSAGAEIERTSMDASGIDSSADSAAVFALLEARPTPNVSLSAGLRRDEFSDFAGATTARLAGAWTTPTGGVLRASWGEGFRAPSLFELNFNLFGLPPNPDLSPERANGFDVGYEQPLFDDRLRLRATYFNLRIRDQIDFDFGTGGFVNIDRVRSRGVEAEGEFSPASFVELSLAYTFTDAIDKATQLPLLRIPKHKGTLVATVRPTGKLALSATVYGNGKERDTGGAVNEAFVRLDLRAAFDISESLQLFGRVENATDTDYQDVAGFAESGAAFYAGVRAHL
jgi:vitamin B12 transporter